MTREPPPPQPGGAPAWVMPPGTIDAGEVSLVDEETTLGGAGQPATGPDSDGISEILAKAITEGYGPARDHAKGLEQPLGHLLLFCIPEAWHDDATREMCNRLSPDDAAAILTWLSLNWSQGYTVGNQDGVKGVNLYEEMGAT